MSPDGGSNPPTLPTREPARAHTSRADHLGPYKKPIALLVLLQLVQTIATLYLPTLNADIIDNGVVNGDTGYI